VVGMMTMQRYTTTKSPNKIQANESGKTFAFNPDYAVNQEVKVQQNINVAVRIRPFSTNSEHAKDDKRSKEKRGWTLEKSGASNTLVEKGLVRKVNGKSVFHFDSVFDEDTKTPLLYMSIARGMVKGVLSGKHATLFVYGQTGSGKTYTMQGDGKRSGGQAGIIQLVTSDVFRFMKQGASMKREFVVKVSYIEIYNETIRDLLSDDPGSTMSHGSNPPTKKDQQGSHLDRVSIRTTASGELVINSIQSEVTSVDQVLEYLISGNAQRKVAKTDMNSHSSRSHAVFRLTVESRLKENIESGNDEIIRISDFNLVDLAGSESVKASNTTGIRLREGAKINQSLLSLSTVIHSLSLPEKKRPKHINYRDSKLTRILQPHLSGNAEIAIVCCISPSKSYTEESRTTLRFASRAKLIRVTPKINEILDDGVKIKKLEKELEKARKMIEQLSAAQNISPVGSNFSQSSKPLQNESIDLDKKSQRVPTVTDYGYEDMAKARNYVVPSQHSTLQPATSNTYETPLKAGLEGQQERPLQYTDPNVLMNSTPDTSDEDSLFEEPLPSLDFTLDAVEEEEGRKTVLKFLHGKDYCDSSTEGDDKFDMSSLAEFSEESENSLPLLDVGVKKDSINTTSKTDDESESYDGPPASYKDVSFKFGSKMSTPDTLGVDTVLENASKYGTHHGQDGCTNTISWDTMGLNAARHEHVGQPLRALKSLIDQDLPIPKEVTIISTSVGDGEPELSGKYEDAVKQVAFLKSKLESADDIIESVFKDLERARLCIHDHVHRNVQLAAKTNEKRRQELKDEYEEGEINLEQYWLLKGSMYVGLFFFFIGGNEIFMASVMLVWLILEANLSS